MPTPRKFPVNDLRKRYAVTRDQSQRMLWHNQLSRRGNNVPGTFFSLRVLHESAVRKWVMLL
jgi:hypothetical protein